MMLYFLDMWLRYKNQERLLKQHYVYHNFNTEDESGYGIYNNEVEQLH